SPKRIKLRIFYRRYFTQPIMRAVMVVIVHPDMRLLPYLVYIFKDIFVQHPSSVTPIEPFHKRILRGFPRLYVLELDIVHHAPFRGDPGYKFRPVFHPYLFWLALFVDKVVEYPDHAVARQGEVNLNMECLSVKIINYIKCPKASFVL